MFIVRKRTANQAPEERHSAERVSSMTRKAFSDKKIQSTFVVGAALRIVGSFSIILLGGLPPDAVRGMVLRTIPAAVGALLMCGAWYLYLIRSERVQEIYA